MKVNSDTIISCLSDYFKAIERLKTDYPTHLILHNPAQTHFLYRGIPDQEYALIPSLFRKQNDSTDPQRMIENRTYLTWGNEKAILQSFIQEASNYISLPTDQLLHWAEYAQHYGAPTRFLDWTSNPLVALYFACCNKKDCDGKVWLLHHPNYMCLARTEFPEELKNVSPKDIANMLINSSIKKVSEGSNYKYPILYTPWYVDTRMSAQSSWFMMWGLEEVPLETMIGEAKYQMDYEEEPPPVRYTSKKHETEFWHRFLVCADRKQSILRELDTVGINEKTLFPGLDGIGRYIERKYHLDYQELLASF